MPTDARWVIMPENEVYGYPEPHLDEHEIARWAVVDAFEDDLPLCTTDLPEKAQKIAEALNLAERVSGRLQGELDKILQVSTYDEA